MDAPSQGHSNINGAVHTWYPCAINLLLVGMIYMLFGMLMELK